MTPAAEFERELEIFRTEAEGAAQFLSEEGASLDHGDISEP
jgi:hypothetical protein